MYFKKVKIKMTLVSSAIDYDKRSTPWIAVYDTGSQMFEGAILSQGICQCHCT